jgi:hypothetical protein
MGVLAEYRAMTRGYMAVCIYFFSEAGILRPHGGPEADSGSSEADSGDGDGQGSEVDSLQMQLPEAENRGDESGGTDE